MTWRDRAACRGADTNLFFPERGDSQKAIKEACERCPVQNECREYATVNFERGYWGSSENQRELARENAA